jgi:putative transposase
MELYRKGSHTVYDIKYHLVWITKYRKPVLTGTVAERLRELIRQICQANEVHILKGHVSKDHLHQLISVPPHLAVSKLMQLLKGTTSVKLQREFKLIQKEFWGRHIWARGYFVASSGNITDEMIKAYIENQDIPTKEEDFKIGD